MYQNLKVEMVRMGVTNEMIADELEQHRNTITNKINGDSDFSISEGFRIREKFFPYADYHYLFRRAKAS